MPRFNGVLTIPFWLDAENENAVEQAADDIVASARKTRANISEDGVELTISEEPRPTNAELSSTI